MPAHDPDEYVELVLALVERIPPGRVMSYGAIAEYVGRGGPRQVGAVMARHGGGVPWHRVVAANGRVVPGHEAEALRRLGGEGTPLRGNRVDMRTATWWPPVVPEPALEAGPAPPEPEPWPATRQPRPAAAPERASQE